MLASLLRLHLISFVCIIIGIVLLGTYVILTSLSPQTTLPVTVAKLATRYSLGQTFLQALQENIETSIDHTVSRHNFHYPNFVSGVPGTAIKSDTEARALQASILCGTDRRARNLDGKTLKNSRNGVFIDDARCAFGVPSQLLPVRPTSVSVLGMKQSSVYSISLCSLLRSKSTLLVGSQTTYKLHSFLLSLTEDKFGQRLICPGALFCTWHQICTSSESLDPAAPITRYDIPPNADEVERSGSSVLRFALSSTLFAGRDSTVNRYNIPYINPETGVREQETYWLDQARQASLIVLNRGPLPAPEWSYELDGTFNVSRLVQSPLVDQKNASELYGHRLIAPPLLLINRFLSAEPFITEAYRIIESALRVSFESFLPSLLTTLRTLRGDLTLRHKLVLWHGSWFNQVPCCPSKPCDVVQVLQLATEGKIIDPATLYYNSQVYIQSCILRFLLPHFGIIYLPLVDIVGVSFADLNKLVDDASPCFKALSTEPGTIDDRKSHNLADEALEEAFFGGLIRTLQYVE